MARRRFKVVVTGRDCMRWLPAALASIAVQSDPDVDVCVVDDGSSDPRQPAFVERTCRDHRWRWLLAGERRGALRNQCAAIEALEPEPRDVIVFVDGDDRLAHDGALALLRAHYEAADPLMSYGSYTCDPPDPYVTPALAFPEDVVLRNAYRAFTARDDPDAVWFNHLRTVTAGLFARLDPATDFTFDDGSWFTVCCDTAVMLPCLEMAAGRHLLVEDVLYVYTRDNPRSDCRVHTAEIERTHARIFSMAPKPPLLPIRPAAPSGARPPRRVAPGSPPSARATAPGSR